MKYVITVCLSLVCITGNAQTQKGNFELSGKTDLNLLFSNITRSTDSLNLYTSNNQQLGFTIGSGYFVANNFSIAFSATYTYRYANYKPSYYLPVGYEMNTSTLAIIPQIRYYLPVSGKLRPSVAAGAGYNWSAERASGVSNPDNLLYSHKGPSYTAGVGVSYFFTQSFALDLNLQYAHNRLRSKLTPDEILIENVVVGFFGVSIFF
jgi:outer membrane protein W